MREHELRRLLRKSGVEKVGCLEEERELAVVHRVAARRHVPRICHHEVVEDALDVPLVAAGPAGAGTRDAISQQARVRAPRHTKSWAVAPS